MPTYEYLCEACGYRFEKFQSIKDEPIRECPDCHEKRVVRVLNGGSGLIFKGSGFYITDYKNNKKTNSSKTDTNSSKKEKDTKKTTVNNRE